MGACYDEIDIEAQTEQEVKEKFNEIIDSCRYDYGHAGYTGTFAEKTDVAILPVPAGQEFWTIEQIREKAHEADKWGPAIAGKISDTEYYVGGLCSS